MNLVLGFYSQLTLPATSQVYDQLYDRALAPILQSLYKNPSQKIILSLGGPALEWIENRHPELMAFIGKMAKAKQIEMLANSFYGTSLALLPPSDRLNAVETSITFLRQRFGVRPKGFWAFDQIWISSMVGPLSQCSLDYLIISNYDQVNSLKLKKPCFYMNELGKILNVLCFDQDYSDIVDKGFEAQWSSLALSLEAEKLKSKDEDCCIMLNLDKLCNRDGAALGFFEFITSSFTRRGYAFRLPSELCQGIDDRDFLYSSTYGSDYVSFFRTPFQAIASNPLSNRLYGRLAIIRDALKLCKADKAVKKDLELQVFKASSSQGLLKCLSMASEAQALSCQLCALEESLMHNGSVDSIAMDMDMDKRKELYFFSKSFNLIIDSKGASLSSLYLRESRVSLIGVSLRNMFCDTFVMKSSSFAFCSKAFSLDDEQWYTCLDSQRSGLEIGKSYRIKSNTIALNYRITNTTGKEIEASWQIFCPMYLESRFKMSSEPTFIFRDKIRKDGKYLSLSSTSRPFMVSCQEEWSDKVNPYTRGLEYYCTQVKLIFDLKLSAKETINETITLKI